MGFSESGHFFMIDGKKRRLNRSHQWLNDEEGLKKKRGITASPSAILKPDYTSGYLYSTAWLTADTVQ